MYVRARERLSYGAVHIPFLGQASKSGDDTLFTKHKRGYHRYGGGRVDDRLKELRENGKLSISDADIEMLQRIANIESRGCIQGINSYDDSFMSMGFMQWTIKYGKLQRFIQHASDAFRRHGIELDAPRKYGITTRWGPSTPIAIKGAQKPNNLRSLDWAKRFYRAGLDPDIIAKEAAFALMVIEETKNSIAKRVGSEFLPYYQISVILRALIQETFNHRPAWLRKALRRAIVRAKKMGKVSSDQFLEMVRGAIKQVYKENGKPQSAENLVNKTKFLKLKGVTC